MTDIKANVGTKEITISARVFRAKENRWVDLGVIAKTTVVKRIAQKLRRILWQQY